MTCLIAVLGNHYWCLRELFIDFLFWYFANCKDQPIVANSIKFKQLITVKQFVNAKAKKVNYTVKNGQDQDIEDAEMNRKELERVSYQIKFQIQDYQKAQTFLKTL